MQASSMHCSAFNRSPQTITFCPHNWQTSTQNCGFMVHSLGSVCSPYHLCYSCLRGSWKRMKITVTFSPVGLWLLQLVTDKVVLILIWDSVLIASCWCMAVSPQPTGKSTDTPWSPELPAKSFSLSVECSLLVGQGSHATEGTLNQWREMEVCGWVP